MRLKYSNARRSLRSTPSPSAYMRPSFHWASAWPCSAAYCSEVTALSFSPARRAWVPDRNASTGLTSGARPAPGAAGTAPGGRGISTPRAGAAAGVAPDPDGRRSTPTGGAPLTEGTPSLGVPSSAKAGMSPTKAPSITTDGVRSEIRIALLFFERPRMGDGARRSRPHLLGVLPEITGREFPISRRPLSLAVSEFRVRKIDHQGPVLGIERDHVAVAQERDRPADRSFGAHVADAEATRGAGETAVGDQGHLPAHPLP